MERDECGTGKNVLKVAARLGVPYLHDHEPQRRAEHLDREPLGRIERSAVNHADIVADIHYRAVDSRADACLPGDNAAADEQQPAECEAQCGETPTSSWARRKEVVTGRGIA